MLFALSSGLANDSVAMQCDAGERDRGDQFPDTNEEKMPAETASMHGD